MGVFAFKILGPLEIWQQDRLVPVRGGHEQAVLAMLLLEAGHVVPLARLIEAVWDADPPQAAEKAVRNTVSALRGRLARAGGSQTLIETSAAGYRLRLDRSQLDRTRFADHAASARHLAGTGRAREAVAEFRAALGLWRGPALSGLGGLVIEAAAARLDEQRLTAWEDCLDLELRLGGHREVTDELRGLVGEHPLREKLAGQLMLALYRAGRQAEALDAYHQLAKQLADDLGLDTSGEIAKLHEAILRQDPVLNPPVSAGEASRTAVAGDGHPERPAGSPPSNKPGPGAVSARPARLPPDVPRQLPAAAPGFTGRVAELTALTRLLDRAGAGTPGTVVISAIGGTAGVGKTALAVHWAQQAADRFPDGQLYVNLRGYDPAEPMRATDALAGFLRALGVLGQHIPPEADERAARYRSLVAGKHMLIVLDNAGSAEQVRPLLPGSSACTLVVTSRDALAGLVALDGAARLDLDVLPADDAVELLRTLIGARVDAEPAAAAELAAQCSRLPLALRVAAELAASRPDVPLAGLAAELADLGNRLDLLEAGGDPRTQVRTVFSWSYRHLDPGAARTFRRLGLHPGPDFDPYAAAAMTGTTVSLARRALDVLARAHLIQPASPGRYVMHDLLHGYARELATTLDAVDEQQAALTRLFDHYLHTAATAMDTLFPADCHRRPRISRPDTPAPPLTDPATARDWLDRERGTLVATAGHAAAHGWRGHAARLAATLSSYLRNGGHYPEALTIFSHALDSARRSGDPIAEATALSDIGAMDFQQARFQQAADHLRQALTLFREAGDRAGEARAVLGIGVAETNLGRYEHAASRQQEAIEIFREIGDRFAEARALGNLGWARQRQGRYREAVGYYQQALALSKEIVDREGEAYSLARLGVVDLRLHRYQSAAGYLEQALALFHDMGNRGGEAEILARLGEVYPGLGRYEEAAANYEQALGMSRKIGDPELEAEALNGLGNVRLHAGDADQARSHHAAALRLASEADVPLVQAHAHRGLARAFQSVGMPARAREHWRQALTLYSAIGAPEADQVRAEMATMDHGQHPGCTPPTDDAN